MLSSWRKKQKSYAFKWGVENLDDFEPERPSFKGDIMALPGADMITGRQAKYVSPVTKSRKLAIAVSIISLLICSVIAAVSGIYILRSYLYSHKQSNSDGIASFVNAVQMNVFKYLYFHIAEKITICK
jgi:uncharacterized membrane-anchored protein